VSADIEPPSAASEAAPQPGPTAPAADAPGRIRSPASGEEQPAGTVIDAHLVWERQIGRLLSIDLDGADERVIAAVRRRVAYLEGLLLGADPRTVAGALAQLRRVTASMAEGTIGRREERRLRLALATLARLSGADQKPRRP
jgi:hypothetical protein